MPSLVLDKHRFLEVETDTSLVDLHLNEWVANFGEKRRRLTIYSVSTISEDSSNAARDSRRSSAADPPSRHQSIKCGEQRTSKEWSKNSSPEDILQVYGNAAECNPLANGQALPLRCGHHSRTAP